jgi:hypothetical protein
MIRSFKHILSLQEYLSNLGTFKANGMDCIKIWKIKLEDDKLLLPILDTFQFRFTKSKSNSHQDFSVESFTPLSLFTLLFEMLVHVLES